MDLEQARRLAPKNRVYSNIPYTGISLPIVIKAVTAVLNRYPALTLADSAGICDVMDKEMQCG